MEIGKHFKSFIGQGSAKSKFHLWLNGYARGSSIPNVFLEAHKGSGKTEMAKMVAREILDIHESQGKERPMFAEVNCSQFNTPNQFIDEIIRPLAEDGIYGVFLLDEFHALDKKIQTALLSFLNPSRDHFAELKWRDQTFRVDKNKFTFLAASTNPEKVLEPLLERMTTVALKPYTEKEIGDIIKAKIQSKISIEENAVKEVARVCRKSPRVAMEILEDLERYAAAYGSKISVSDWNNYRQTMEVLPLGLTQTEMRMLEVLEEVGGETQNQIIAATMGMDRKTISDNVQNYPISQGLIEIIDGSKRLLTKEGREILKKKREIFS